MINLKMILSSTIKYFTLLYLVILFIPSLVEAQTFTCGANFWGACITKQNKCDENSGYFPIIDVFPNEGKHCEDIAGGFCPLNTTYPCKFIDPNPPPPPPPDPNLPPNTFKCKRNTSTLTCGYDATLINCDSGYVPQFADGKTCLDFNSGSCPDSAATPCKLSAPQPPQGSFACEWEFISGNAGVCRTVANNCGGSEQPTFNGRTCEEHISSTTCPTGNLTCESSDDDGGGGGGDGGVGDPTNLLVDLDALIDSMGSEKLSGFDSLGTIVSAVLPLLYGISGFALFLFLIFAGFKYLTSAGDPKKLESAKGSLTAAILGFALIFAAYWITQVVNYIFNLQSGF